MKHRITRYLRALAAAVLLGSVLLSCSSSKYVCPAYSINRYKVEPLPY